MIRANEVARVAGVCAADLGTRDAGSCSKARALCHRCRAPRRLAHCPSSGKQNRPAAEISVSCARKTQVRSKIRSISSRHTSSLTKISRLTSPRRTSTQLRLPEAEACAKTWCTREISLTLQTSPTRRPDGKLPLPPLLLLLRQAMVIIVGIWCFSHSTFSIVTASA